MKLLELQYFTAFEKFCWHMLYKLVRNKTCFISVFSHVSCCCGCGGESLHRQTDGRTDHPKSQKQSLSTSCTLLHVLTCVTLQNTTVSFFGMVPCLGMSVVWSVIWSVSKSVSIWKRSKEAKYGSVLSPNHKFYMIRRWQNTNKKLLKLCLVSCDLATLSFLLLQRQKFRGTGQ